MVEIEATNIGIDFFCNHCENNVKITKSNMLPARDFEYDSDDFLIFMGRCPRCGHIFEIHNGTEIIPKSVQKELLDTYAGIADETYKVWQEEANYQDITKRLEMVREKLAKAKEVQTQKEQESGYVKRLYPNWYSNSEVIERLK